LTLLTIACPPVVYAKRPFAGPAAVLAYLARYTHRVAISNSRLVAFDEASVTFRWKDYRIKGQRRALAYVSSAVPPVTRLTTSAIRMIAP
jgi:Putative transposase